MKRWNTSSTPPCERCTAIADAPDRDWSVAGMVVAAEVTYVDGTSVTPLECRVCFSCWERTYEPVANRAHWEACE